MKKVLITIGVLSIIAFAVVALQQPVTNVDASSQYEDGTYRGIFADGGEFQVNVQFTLEDEVITNIRFRHLAYGGNDYLDSDDETIKGLAEQHQELLDYLEGKNISAMKDLHEPGNIVDGKVMDAFSGATLRGNKIVSAMRDALNREVYSY